jgi:hypothetical protein
MLAPDTNGYNVPVGTVTEEAVIEVAETAPNDNVFAKETFWLASTVIAVTPPV